MEDGGGGGRSRVVLDDGNISRDAIVGVVQGVVQGVSTEIAGCIVGFCARSSDGRLTVNKRRRVMGMCEPALNEDQISCLEMAAAELWARAGDEDACDLQRILVMLMTLPELISVSDREIAAFATPVTRHRYYIACSRDVRQATEGLASSLLWRREERPELAVCPLCVQDGTSHNMRMVGYDRDMYPIVYTNFGTATNRWQVRENMLHCRRTLEDCARLLDKHHGGSGQWTFVIDFSGYSVLYDSNPINAIEMSKLLAHYPERMRRVIILDAGFFFDKMFAFIRKLLNKRTAAKIEITKFENLGEVLGETCDAPVRDWLIAEVAENRGDRRHGKRFWEPLSEAHDSRGAPNFFGTADYSEIYPDGTACTSAPV